MKKIIYILFLVFGVWSCDDFLDREPVEQVSISQQFSSVDGLLQALGGVYSEYEELYSGLSFVYADAIAGNVKFAPNQQGLTEIPDQFQPVYSFQEQATEGTFSAFYSNAYGIINALNLILENIDDVPNLTPDLEQQVRAETLAMRASVHFELSKLFAQTYNFTPQAQHLGIVYNTRTLVAGEDFPSRESLAETYNLIEADFNQALDLFTDSSVLEGPETSYFNEVNTRALLSRLYLYKGDWQSTIDQANIVLNTGVELTPRENLLEQWSNFEPLSETLFEFTPPLTGDEGNVSSSVSVYFEVVVNNDEVLEYGRYTASNDLVALYDPNDIRGTIGLLLTQNVPTQTATEVVDLPYDFTQKFPANDGAVMIRLSEVLLNKAEAHARQGENTQAQADLQAIRSRANPNAETINLTGQDLIDEILLERRRELAFEGHLLYDLARNGQSIVRNDGCTISICQLDFPNDRFILPIPENSVLINENMVQNEGY